MTYERQKTVIDAPMIVMGLAYLTTLLVLVGWLVTVIP